MKIFPIIWLGVIILFYVMFLRLGGLTGSALDHRSIPPQFEPRHIWRVFNFFDFASLPLEVTRPINLAYHVYKSSSSFGDLARSNTILFYIQFLFTRYSIYRVYLPYESHRGWCCLHLKTILKTTKLETPGIIIMGDCYNIIHIRDIIYNETHTTP